jgi:beta-xylosidase
MDQLRRLGITMGQAIDPSIYTEQDGSMYLLYGNGHAAIVELGEDMIHVREETMRNLEGLHEFREAVTVLKRDELYHFTWSCDDTGSEDYHVNYGTSESLYGPVTYHYTVLSKNVTKGMLGTGHHCIIHDPRTDQYHIAYHRFVTPLSRFSTGKGYHREVCIDPIFFGEDGLMKPVVL